jgi:hypothetical protein
MNAELDVVRSHFGARIVGTFGAAGAARGRYEHEAESWSDANSGTAYWTYIKPELIRPDAKKTPATRIAGASWRGARRAGITAGLTSSA